MRTKVSRIIFLFAVIVAGNHSLYAASPEEANDLAAGGRLYDKWWIQARETEPGSTHRSYPKTAKQTGSATWRCKECHGWDYRGKDGAYARGSHFTGIKGIRSMSGKPVDQIETVMKNPAHGYDKVLSPSALAQLARFVAYGQVDMDRFIDRKTKSAKGSSAKGKRLFSEYCVDCHGKDGRKYNFKEKSGGKEYLGTIANDNPWEALHKIVNGHPGETGAGRGSRMHGDGMGPGMHEQMQQRMGSGRHMWETMPAMRTRVQESAWADILAYLQTLPK